MSFLYYIVIFLLIVVVLQLTLKLKIFFNVKNNTGKLQFKFIFFTVFDYQISIKNMCLRFTSKKGKNKYIPLDLSQESIQNYADFQSILFRKIYFKTISIYFNFGVKSDAFLSSIICGYVDVFSKIFYAIFKTKKSELKMQLKVYPSFNKNVIKFSIKAKISLSLFDLFWSFTEATLTKQLRAKKIKEFSHARK